jgi:deoxyribodipyrimidine photo-lyase
MAVPSIRVRTLRAGPVRPERRWVLYWMTSFRRTRFNFSLDRALEHARALKKPLVVLEALRVGYPDANDRLHTFILEGMAENARRFAGAPVLHLPYVEEAAGDGAGLLEALAAESCVVVCDDWPCYFVPRMQAAAAKRLDVAFEVVDSNGLWPMHATDRVFTTAHSFRAHLQKTLAPHLSAMPNDAPLEGLDLPTAKLPASITSRWSRAPKDLLEATPAALAALPIDHSVPPGRFRGGSNVERLPRGAQRAGGRRHQRAVALPALRPRLGAPRLRRGGAPREVDARRAGQVHRRLEGGLVEDVGGRRGLPR